MERARQAKWDAEHLRTVGTKLSDAEVIILRVLCKSEGMTVYALIQKLLREWIAKS